VTENEKDIELLRTRPRELVAKYQSAIEAIIAHFTESGLLKASDFEDHRQAINLMLLDKLPQMQANYSGAAQFRTYLSAIVRNMCREIYRRGKREPQIVPLEDYDIPDGDAMQPRYEIEAVCRRLEVILTLYHSERPKLELLLRIHFHIRITLELAQRAFPFAGWHELRSFVAAMKKTEEISDHETYASLMPWINNFEGKANAPDTFRKWMDAKINDVIQLLNGDPPTRHFTRKTLKILLEKFFSPETEKL
jgi:DNA-directed RNA polymerase specialized sigma24 family protein